jgi:hypothetical protein
VRHKLQPPWTPTRCPRSTARDIMLHTQEGVQARATHPACFDQVSRQAVDVPWIVPLKMQTHTYRANARSIAPGTTTSVLVSQPREIRNTQIVGPIKKMRSVLVLSVLPTNNAKLTLDSSNTEHTLFATHSTI